MRDDLKNLADIFYLRIVSPGNPINILWVRKTFREMDMVDENIEKFADLNAPLSREVWYYTFLRAFEDGKLDVYLNRIKEITGLPENPKIDEILESLHLRYLNGKFSQKIFRVVVLVSGRGTNLQALIDAVENGMLNVKLVAVISNKKRAYALERARSHGIPAIYIPAKKGEKRENYDKRLAKKIDEYTPDLIVLAGFLRILSPWFVKKYRNRIINIHPALLPSFAGLYGENVHKAVLEYGCKVSGCTVHFVDENIDHGPIIVQKCVEVRDTDTPETLAARVLEKEHEALVEAVKLISEGKIVIKDRRVLTKR